jgi:hypothetical protein
VGSRGPTYPPPKTGRIYPSDRNCICLAYGDYDSCRYPKGSNCPWCHYSDDHDWDCRYLHEQPMLPEDRERMEERMQLEQRAAMWKGLFFIVLVIAAIVILNQSIG